VRLVGGDLAADDLRAVSAWTEANAEALLGYWDGRLAPSSSASRMKRV
jgi:hypothetical protein